MDCQYLSEHSTITGKTGQKLCARHHVPLITAHGYSMATVLGWHPRYEARVVASCNPNYIDPTQSLTRKPRYTYPMDITYCPTCEVIVAQWRARPDAERRPSVWRQLSTNIHFDD
jgi:hypothetical protein